MLTSIFGGELISPGHRGAKVHLRLVPLVGFHDLPHFGDDLRADGHERVQVHPTSGDTAISAGAGRGFPRVFVDAMVVGQEMVSWSCVIIVILVIPDIVSNDEDQQRTVLY